MVANNCKKLFLLLSLFQLLLGLAYDNRSIFSSAMAVAAASTPPTTTPECAVVGVGVLGTSLCKQLLRDPDLKDWKVSYRNYKKYETTRTNIKGGFGRR